MDLKRKKAEKCQFFNTGLQMNTKLEPNIDKSLNKFLTLR